MIDKFPYKRLGLNKELDEVRLDMFRRLEQLHDDYSGKGYLPAALNLNRGPARGLIELSNWGRYQVNRDVSALIPQCFPIYATDYWLDLHAASVLLTRKEAVQASGHVTFVRQKTGGNIKIPRNRLVRTKPDGLGEIYRFVTTEDIVLPQDELSVKVPVIAENYGQNSNVTVGSICEIVTAVAGIDFVTNEADWLVTEGADEESDDSLRHRYYLQWRSISGLNKYFYESLARSVPGVDDVKVNDQHPRGQGTVDIVIKGTAGIPTQKLVNQVSAVIEENKPQIDDYLVLAPQSVNVHLNLILQVTQGNHDDIKKGVENRLRALFMTPRHNLGVELLKIGEDLTHSRIIGEAMRIKGIKAVNVINPPHDLEVPNGGLAVLNSITINSENARE